MLPSPLPESNYYVVFTKANSPSAPYGSKTKLRPLSGPRSSLHRSILLQDLSLSTENICTRANRTTPLLYPANTVRHDQDLAERMGVPCGARARLESHCSTAGATWLSWIEERLHTNGTRKSLGGARNNVSRSGRRDRDLRSARLGSGNVIHHYRSQQEC